MSDDLSCKLESSMCSQATQHLRIGLVAENIHRINKFVVYAEHKVWINIPATISYLCIYISYTRLKVVYEQKRKKPRGVYYASHTNSHHIVIKGGAEHEAVIIDRALPFMSEISCNTKHSIYRLILKTRSLQYVCKLDINKYKAWTGPCIEVNYRLLKYIC